MTQELNNKLIIIAIFLLVAVILIFEFTSLDYFIQSYFYDYEKEKWLIQRDNETLKYIFYDGFKSLFKLFSIFVIVLCILSFFKRFKILNSYKKGLLILMLSMMFVPTLAVLKNYTNMPCPVNTVKFGGNYPEAKLFEPYPKEFIQDKKSRCWPAGHATMGFSLMALYFLFKKQRNKNIALVFGVLAGVLTGGYKMLIGDHFISHTLVTLLGAILIILILRKLVYKYLK